MSNARQYIATALAVRALLTLHTLSPLLRTFISSVSAASVGWMAAGSNPTERPPSPLTARAMSTTERCRLNPPKPIRAFAIRAGIGKHPTNAPAGTVAPPKFGLLPQNPP